MAAPLARVGTLSSAERLLSGFRRRPTASAALIYAVVVLIFIGPALLPGKTLSNSDTLWFEPPWASARPSDLSAPSNTELGDAPRHLQLFLHATEEKLPHIPLWNPYIQGGRPFLANSQSAIFSPFSMPAYILPFWTALGWIAVLKLWVAAFGTFLLARSLGLRFGGALLAGIVFALNLKMVSWLSYPHTGIWALLPWLLLLTDQVIRRADLLAGAGLAALVGLQFLTGHAETSFHVLLATGAFFVLRLWQARRAGAPEVERLRRPILAFAGATAGGLALAAVTLLPFGELLWLSADLRDRAGKSVDLHLPANELIGIFMPDYWGRPTQTLLRQFLLERALYVGALPLMLAAAALILRPKIERVWVALFGGLFFAVVVGIPPFVQVVTRLPVFSSGHNTRLIILAMLAVALLAGWGLDDLTSGRFASRSRRWITIGVATILLLVPLVFVVVGRRASFGDLGGALRVAWLFEHAPGGFGAPAGEGIIRLSSLISWLTLAGAGLLLIVLRLRGRLGSAPFVALASLVVCVDLFRIGMGYNPAIDRDHATVPATGAIRFLQRQGPERFVTTEEISPNVIPMRFHLYEARGYDVPIIRRFDRLWRREVTPGSATVAGGLLDIPLRFLEVNPRSLRTMRLLGVTHLLQPKTLPVTKPPFDRFTPFPVLREPGLRLVYDGPDARVYRLDGALPRAFVVPAQQVVDGGDAALDAVADRSFDGRRVAITEAPLPGLPEAGGAATVDRANDARIVTYEPEHVVIRARSGGAGLLVLSDNDFPGWKATVDGRPADVERVDYLFRGVRLGPGAHTVEFRYQPLSWRIGWIVSLVALVLLAAVAVTGLRRRSRAAASPSGAGSPSAPA